jgi:hypothetical protein
MPKKFVVPAVVVFGLAITFGMIYKYQSTKDDSSTSK